MGQYLRYIHIYNSSIGSSRPETDSKVNNDNSIHEVLDPDSLIVNTNTTDDLDNIADKNSDDITGDASTSVIKLDNVKKSDEEQNLSSPLRNVTSDAGGAGDVSNDNKNNLGQHHDCKRTDSKRRKRTVSKKSSIIRAIL